MSSLPFHPCPVVLAAPSGTGKTTIAHALVECAEDFVFSVSATTRPPREGEREGEHYEFVTPSAFQQMIDRDELVEWARVHGNLYGTPRRNLEASAGRGEHVVLDIDVQGAGQIRETVPEAVLIFVFPPSAAALVERLTVRGTEEKAEVRRRLAAAREELERASDFDYVVVNDSLEEAVRQVQAIVKAESHRPGRARALSEEVERLRSEIDRTLEQPDREETGGV